MGLTQDKGTVWSDTMKKIIKYILIAILLLCIIFCAVNCKRYNINDQYNQDNQTFSKEGWDKYPEKRIEMVDYLTREYKIIGLSKKDIIDLLGENAILMNNQDMIEYFVSPGYADVVGFIIFFDKNSIAYKFKISLH